MPIFVKGKSMPFHKSYIDRVPAKKLPVYHHKDEYCGLPVTLDVYQAIRTNKFWWILDFGAKFVFWSEEYSTLQFQNMEYLMKVYIESWISSNRDMYAVCKPIHNADRV